MAKEAPAFQGRVATRMVLDAGALIAVDRGDRAMWRRLRLALDARVTIVTHAAVLAQVWRRPARQARLARALSAVDVVSIDPAVGKQAGLLLQASGTADVVDAALIVLCRTGDVIYTSDPDDLSTLLAATGKRGVDVVPV